MEYIRVLMGADLSKDKWMNLEMNFTVRKGTRRSSQRGCFRFRLELHVPKMNIVFTVLSKMLPDAVLTDAEQCFILVHCRWEKMNQAVFED